MITTTLLLTALTTSAFHTHLDGVNDSMAIVARGNNVVVVEADLWLGQGRHDLQSKAGARVIEKPAFLVVSPQLAVRTAGTNNPMNFTETGEVLRTDTRLTHAARDIFQEGMLGAEATNVAYPTTAAYATRVPNASTDVTARMRGGPTILTSVRTNNLATRVGHGTDTTTTETRRTLANVTGHLDGTTRQSTTDRSIVNTTTNGFLT